MNKKEIRELLNDFHKDQKKLKAFKPKQKVYVTDVYGDVFDCEVVSVDLEENVVHILDHSYTNMEGKPKAKTLPPSSVYTEQEIEEYMNSSTFKYKIF